MTHAIIELQTSIISRLNADPDVIAAIGANGIFDMPPKGNTGPHIVVARHDLINRDADIAPGNDHRIQLRIWVPEPSRSVSLEIAEFVVQVMTGASLSTSLLKVTNVRHERTDTAIELKTGRAHATVVFRILSEPTV